MFLIIFCVVSPKKYIHFCVYFLFSKPPRCRCCLCRQAGHCFLVGEVAKYIYINICIKRCKLFFWHFISCIFNWFKESFKFRKHISGSMKHTVGEHWKAFYAISDILLDSSLIQVCCCFFLLLLLFLLSTPQENFSRNFCSHAIWRFYSLWIYFCSYIFLHKIQNQKQPKKKLYLYNI